MLQDAALDERYGRDERLAFRQAEKAAVLQVEALIAELELDVDRHSLGETELAHRPKDMISLQEKARSVEENYGVTGHLIEPSALAEHGLAGAFHGALNIPIGFGLNPLKYITGLATAAERAGTIIYCDSCVQEIRFEGGHHRLRTDTGTLIAKQVIVATNGYSSENLPPWLAGRYMPSQSTVLVTRPLTDAEIEAQGWHSDQMCYDTRHLLHYFRLMPDRRFLFGMRGGLLSGPAAEARARRRTRRDFSAIFPAWAGVEVQHQWSGMVCLARDRLPFVGQIASGSGLWAGLCYHGNGVAMGTFSGKLLANLILQKKPDLYPLALRRPLDRFPFGRARRVTMPPIYAGLIVADQM